MWFEHDVEFGGKSIEQIIYILYLYDRDQPTRKSIVQILIVLHNLYTHVDMKKKFGKNTTDLQAFIFRCARKCMYGYGWICF